MELRTRSHDVLVRRILRHIYHDYMVLAETLDKLERDETNLMAEAQKEKPNE